MAVSSVFKLPEVFGDSNGANSREERNIMSKVVEYEFKQIQGKEKMANTDTNWKNM